MTKFLFTDQICIIDVVHTTKIALYTTIKLHNKSIQSRFFATSAADPA
jgi:hypothetical protein